LFEPAVVIAFKPMVAMRINAQPVFWKEPIETPEVMARCWGPTMTRGRLASVRMIVLDDKAFLFNRTCV
jgi:hypothetical protein